MTTTPKNIGWRKDSILTPLTLKRRFACYVDRISLHNSWYDGAFEPPDGLPPRDNHWLTRAIPVLPLRDATDLDDVEDCVATRNDPRNVHSSGGSPIQVQSDIPSYTKDDLQARQGIP